MNFEFVEDGQLYRVHSVTGNGLTKVVVEEVNPPAPEVALEPSEDA